MKFSSFLAFALANSSRLCSATPALRRQDQDQEQDPRKLQVVQSKHGSRALEDVDSVEGRCLDSEGRHYDRIIFGDIADDQECLLTCPPTNFVGYEMVNTWCNCRYSTGYVLNNNQCPDAAFSCETAADGGVGPVDHGDGTGGIICKKANANFQETIASLQDEVASLEGEVASLRAGAAVISFDSLFEDAECVPDVTYWDVSDVTDFKKMFFGATGMNQDVSSWDVSRGQNFASMFSDTNFDQDIGNWNVTNGNSFRRMFKDTPFRQNLSGWRITVRHEYYVTWMFEGSEMNNIDHCPCISVGEGDWLRRCPGVRYLYPIGNPTANCF